MIIPNQVTKGAISTRIEVLFFFPGSSKDDFIGFVSVYLLGNDLSGR